MLNHPPIMFSTPDTDVGCIVCRVPMTSSVERASAENESSMLLRRESTLRCVYVFFFCPTLSKPESEVATSTFFPSPVTSVIIPEQRHNRVAVPR